MSKGKILLGVLAGIAAGALIGVLLSPEKGSDLRKRYPKKERALLKDLRKK
jgi:gas vesicle protein